jgi:hypothetical protein
MDIRGPGYYEPKETKGEDQFKKKKKEEVDDIAQQMDSLSIRDTNSGKISFDVVSLLPKNLPIDRNEVRQPLAKLLGKLITIFRNNPNATVQDSNIQKAQTEAEEDLLKKNKILYGSKDPTRGNVTKGYFITHLPVLIEKAKERASQGVEPEKSSNKLQKIHAIIQENPDVIHLATKTNSIKFLKSDAPFIKTHLETLVDNLTKLFMKNPNGSVVDIQKMQRECEVALGKVIQSSPRDFQCFVELAKMRAQTKPSEIERARFHALSLQPKDLVQHLKTLHVSKGNIVELLDGQDRLFNTLLEGVDYDINALKQLIGPKYREVFNSIYALQFDKDSEVSNFQFERILDEMRHIQSLYVAGSYLTDPCIHKITQMVELRHLTLNGKQYKPTDMHNLSMNLEASLTELDLSNTRCQVGQLEHLIHYSPNIQSLTLMNCQSLKWEDPTRFTTLQNLNVSGCGNFDDACIENILPFQKDLQRLDISFTSVRGATLAKYIPKSLKELIVGGPSLEEEYLAKVRQHYPNLKITVRGKEDRKK